jgi:3-deoxy-7-phosphoheptulonate synthase
MSSEWSLTSWRGFPVKQQPIYPDAAALETSLQDLRRLPPLVTSGEVDDLRSQLAEVAEGKRFLLQGGDCAERFQDCSSDSIEKQLRILLQMSLVLTWGARVPTLRVARMAGQFAKPRSKDTEVVGGVEYPAFRGDNVNSFDVSARSPDPSRLLMGYFHSAASLNYARAALASGLADLNSTALWDLGFVQDPRHRHQYNQMLERILSSLDFMRVCGVGQDVAMKTASIFMSHEGLQLDYEEALTRPCNKVVTLKPHTPFSSRPSSAPASNAAGSGGASGASDGEPAAAAAEASPPPLASGGGGGGGGALLSTPSKGTSSSSSAPSARYYNLGTHFLWIGDRTRQLDHAHVEYMRGIVNPVGVKAGPTSDPDELVRVIRRLWPSPRDAPGKIVIITRLGASGTLAALPRLISAVKAANFESPVVWVCDPMHGNTKVTSSGYKTREFDDILAELKCVCFPPSALPHLLPASPFSHSIHTPHSSPPLPTQC